MSFYSFYIDTLLFCEYNMSIDSHYYERRMQMTKQINPRATVLTIALGTFMSSFDINAANIALPMIQSKFNTSIAVVEWVVVAYLLTLCATQLTFGRTADLYGFKKLYVTGSIGFTLSSLLCGISASISMLIVFRVTQALCASMMIATGSAIITNSVPASNRGKALSLSAISVAVATCVGPSLGGLLASAFGWNSIFLINVPIGIVETVLSLRYIQKDSGKPSSKFDPLGSLLIMAALILILLPLDMVSSTSRFDLLTLSLLAAGVVLLGVFVLYETHCDHPILNMQFFRNRVFTASNLAATFFYTAEFILVFLAPFYLQKVRMLTPTAAGIMMLPLSLAMIVCAPVSGAISDKIGSRSMCGLGMLILAVSTLFMSGYTQSTPTVLLILIFALCGIGAGLFQTPNNSTVMGSVPAENRGIAAATLGTMRNIGMVLGEAISAAIIASSLNGAGGTPLAEGTPQWQSAFLTAMQAACITAAGCALGAMVLSFAKGKENKTNELKEAGEIQ